MEESYKNNCFSCLDDFIIFGKKHIGKLGVFSGILGIGTGILVSSNLILASGIIMGITNFNVLISGIFYEKLQSEYSTLEKENINLSKENISLSNEKNEMVRRYTTFQAFQQTNTPTARSEISSTSSMEKPIEIFNLLNTSSTTTQPFEE